MDHGGLAGPGRTGKSNVFLSILLSNYYKFGKAIIMPKINAPIMKMPIWPNGIDKKAILPSSTTMAQSFPLDGKNMNEADGGASGSNKNSDLSEYPSYIHLKFEEIRPEPRPNWAVETAEHEGGMPLANMVGNFAQLAARAYCYTKEKLVGSSCDPRYVVISDEKTSDVVLNMVGNGIDAAGVMGVRPGEGSKMANRVFENLPVRKNKLTEAKPASVMARDSGPGFSEYKVRRRKQSGQKNVQVKAGDPTPKKSREGHLRNDVLGKVEVGPADAKTSTACDTRTVSGSLTVKSELVAAREPDFVERMQAWHAKQGTRFEFPVWTEVNKNNDFVQIHYFNTNGLQHQTVPIIEGKLAARGSRAIQGQADLQRSGYTQITLADGTKAIALKPIEGDVWQAKLAVDYMQSKIGQSAPRVIGIHFKKGEARLVLEKLSNPLFESRWSRLSESQKAQLENIYSDNIISEIKKYDSVNLGRESVEADYLFTDEDGNIKVGLPVRVFGYSRNLEAGLLRENANTASVTLSNRRNRIEKHDDPASKGNSEVAPRSRPENGVTAEAAGASEIIPKADSPQRMMLDDQNRWEIYSYPDGTLTIRVDCNKAYAREAASNILRKFVPSDEINASNLPEARLGKDGRVIILEGKHRAVALYHNAQIPPDPYDPRLGGVPGRPGWMEFLYSPEFNDLNTLGVPLQDLKYHPEYPHKLPETNKEKKRRGDSGAPMHPIEIVAFEKDTKDSIGGHTVDKIDQLEIEIRSKQEGRSIDGRHFDKNTIETMAKTIEDRMRQLGIPAEAMGLTKNKIAFDHADKNQGTNIQGWIKVDENVPSRWYTDSDIEMGAEKERYSGIAVGGGIFDEIPGFEAWNKASLSARLDAVITHEYFEYLGATHNEAVERAPNTKLKITKEARDLLSEMRRLPKT